MSLKALDRQFFWSLLRDQICFPWMTVACRINGSLLANPKVEARSFASTVRDIHWGNLGSPPVGRFHGAIQRIEDYAWMHPAHTMVCVAKSLLLQRSLTFKRSTGIPNPGLWALVKTPNYWCDVGEHECWYWVLVRVPLHGSAHNNIFDIDQSRWKLTNMHS